MGLQVSVVAVGGHASRSRRGAGAHGLDRSTPVPSGSFGVRGFSGLWAAGFGGVGALLTRRRPGHPVGWIFAAAGMLAAVDFASFEYALAVVVGHRDLPAGEYVGWLQLWIWFRSSR